MEESCLYHEDRMEQRNQHLRNENDRIESQHESERRENKSREWQREDIQNQIDRARRFGDDYNADKLKKVLRNI